MQLLNISKKKRAFGSFEYSINKTTVFVQILRAFNMAMDQYDFFGKDLIWRAFSLAMGRFFSIFFNFLCYCFISKQKEVM